MLVKQLLSGLLLTASQMGRSSGFMGQKELINHPFLLRSQINPSLLGQSHHSSLVSQRLAPCALPSRDLRSCHTGIQPLSVNAFTDSRVGLDRGIAVNAVPAEGEADECELVSKTDMTRKWNGFWKEGISIKRHQARRHIIMVHSFKQAMQSMRVWAEDQCQIESLRDFYRHLVIQQGGEPEYDGEIGESVGDIDDFVVLEKAVFRMMVNMKFNIVIGSDIQNRALNDISTVFERDEERLLKAINECISMDNLQAMLVKWCDKNLHYCHQGGQSGYRRIRHEIDQTIFRLLTTFSDQNTDLEQCKQEKRALLLSLYDSTATDISQVKNDTLRKWQNQKLLPLQQEMLELIDEPEFERFSRAVNAFLALEVEGVELLGLDQDKLNNYTAYPDEVAAFKKAISC